MTVDEDVLADMLADSIKVPREDFSKKHLDVLLLLGMGMFWSEELDITVNDLANAIQEEFTRQNPYA